MVKHIISKTLVTSCFISKNAANYSCAPMQSVNNAGI